MDLCLSRNVTLSTSYEHINFGSLVNNIIMQTNVNEIMYQNVRYTILIQNGQMK